MPQSGFHIQHKMNYLLTWHCITDPYSLLRKQKGFLIHLKTNYNKTSLKSLQKDIVTGQFPDRAFLLAVLPQGLFQANQSPSTLILIISFQAIAGNSPICFKNQRAAAGDQSPLEKPVRLKDIVLSNSVKIDYNLDGIN